MDDYVDYSVPIPAKVKTRMEVIDGVGIKEIIITFIAAAIGGIIAYIFNSITSQIVIALVIFGIITGCTFLFVMKDKNNQCVAEIFMNMIRFFRSQRTFMYEVEEINFYNTYLNSLKEKGVYIK